eukprot:SAG31_NODE_6280_length_2089_cov_1.747236_3_plen_89_part_00
MAKEATPLLLAHATPASSQVPLAQAVAVAAPAAAAAPHQPGLQQLLGRSASMFVRQHVELVEAVGSVTFSFLFWIFSRFDGTNRELRD